VTTELIRLQILMQVQSPQPTNENSLHKNMSHVKIGTPVFLHSSIFQPTLKILLHKVCLSVEVSTTPRVIHVPWTHATQYHKLHLNRFSCFCTVHGRENLYFI